MAKIKVFVIMPFVTEFVEVYNMLKKEFQHEFEFSHAYENEDQPSSLTGVVQSILDASIIIADLTTLNPNVMYELGLAHALNKKTIIITQDDLNNLPFDLKQYRAKDYSTHFTKIHELTLYLERTLHGSIDDSILFSNPVKDYLSQHNLNVSELYDDNYEIQLQIEDDDDYLRFLTEIKNDSEKMVDNINAITEGLTKMDEGVKQSTDEIYREKNNNRKFNSSFLLRQIKKVSSLIEEFDNNLKKHNTENDILWDKIEKNSLGLLETKFIKSEQDKDGIMKYISALIGLKNVTITCRSYIGYLKDTLNQLGGIEQSINQSVRFCVQDLEFFLAFTERMETSINKIEQRSHFILDPIQ